VVISCSAPAYEVHVDVATAAAKVPVEQSKHEDCPDVDHLPTLHAVHSKTPPAE